MDFSTLLPLITKLNGGSNSNNVISNILPELLKNGGNQNPMQSILLNMMATKFTNPNTTNSSPNNSKTPQQNSTEQSQNPAVATPFSQTQYKTPFNYSKEDVKPPSFENFPPFKTCDNSGKIVEAKTETINNVFPNSNLETTQQVLDEQKVNTTKKEDTPPQNITTPFGYKRVYWFTSIKSLSINASSKLCKSIPVMLLNLLSL